MPEKAASHLLLTGAPGCGKTTVIRRLAERLPAARGFYTAEIREGGARRGFRLVELAGGERLMAHVDLPRRHRVGRYGVDVAAVDAAADALAGSAEAAVYLIDEIGRMECLSERFVATVRALLDGSTPVVATVALKGGGFIAEAKRCPRCALSEVTPANREALPAEIANRLAARGVPVTDSV